MTNRDELCMSAKIKRIFGAEPKVIYGKKIALNFMVF
jgi:hypothetical protein